MNDTSELTTYAIIDLDAITSNIMKIRDKVGGERKVYGVVKANAYGHGIGHIAQTAVAAGVYGLAVGRTNEGVQLRSLGLDVPILNLCYTIPGEAAQSVANDLITAINTLEGAQALSEAAGRLGKKAVIHLKIDSGMGRYGQLPAEAVAFMQTIAKLPHLVYEGIFTHFATADSADKTFARHQFAVFQETMEALRKAGFEFPIRHAANSAAVLDMPETYLDAVRPGIILYGMYTSDEVSHEIGVTPALTLKSHLGRIRTLPAGSNVGYGGAYITPKDMKVGLVPVGYGDGYHRLLSNRGEVLIRGRRVPIIGRICMDQFMVNLDPVEDAAQDDEVILIGRQGDAHLSAEEVAGWADTINYEVTTGLLRRIPRAYVRGGRVEDVARLTTCEF